MKMQKHVLIEQMIGWTHINSRRFRSPTFLFLTIVGEARLWYESL